ncbi:MAG TPA: hypothetical protein VEA58_03730 [Anaerovoracaceae bacterium]|nr:hypothetical protein [Anaerovoracaceae bacterium]
MIDKDFRKLDRIIGKAAALSLLGLGIIYAVVLILGLLSLETKMDPIGDPYVSIMEIIIILMAPLMVVLMVEVHTHASGDTKTLSLIALVFMVIAACITSCVHYVILTVSLQTDFTTDQQWLQQLLFSWKWPSVVYALDILAWDLFFSLSMLFAAPIFKGNRLEASIRITMTVSGVLSLAGLIGPIVADMQIRMIGVVGYTVFFPLACLLLAKLFSRPAISSTVNA